MMGHLIKSCCGGTLLCWSALLIPLLVNVALRVEGFPLYTNSSFTKLYGEGSSEEDDENVSESYELDRGKEFLMSPSQTGSNLSQQSSVITSPNPNSSQETTSSTQLVNHSSHSDKYTSKNGDFKAALLLQDDPSDLIDGLYSAPVDANTAPASISDRDGIDSLTSSGDLETSDGSIGVPKVRELTLDKTSEVKLTGFSFDYDSDKRRVSYDENGSPVVLEGMEVKLTLFGKFTKDTYFRFSKFHRCDDPMNQEAEHKIEILDEDNSVGIVHVKIPEAGEQTEVYSCLRAGDSKILLRQGESKTGEFGLPIQPWLVLKLTKSMFPLYLHVFFIVLLLMLSGLFSGLNLGLMSLDKTEIKIIMNTGSKSEKQYAQSIAPVRNHGNFLLCCLLFSNVLVNATLTILVDDLTTGIIAIIGSTLAIVIFGEIIPQAICSRFGLAVGAKTIYITKFFMLLTAPMAFPLSLLLDKILGEEIGNIYNRERLKELLKVTKDHHGLENEEVGIISGALDLKTKTVKDVMVKLEQIFMLPSDTILDFDTMAEIEYQGYSRIPVYEGERSNVVALINVRQLTLLDASDNIPLRTVMDYYKTNLFFVFENTHLDFMFKAFREGNRGHMAFVQRVNDEGPGDPYYETVGMLTMEDVLEEILQADIRDENDVGKLNARSGNTKRPPPVPFANHKKPGKKVVEVPATLALAATQFLSTSVDSFKYGTISVTIIQRLLKTNVQFVKAPKRKARQQVQEVYLYETGKPADCFIMILEGRVQVTVGRERLMYEAGPFTAFGNDFLLNDSLGVPLRAITTGESSLSSPTDVDPSERPSITSDMTDLKRRATFIPDYSVKVLTDVYFVRVRYDHYRHALAATELERAYTNDPEMSLEEPGWQEEIEKVLNTGDDEEDGKDDQKDARPNILVNGNIDKLQMEDKEGSTSTETDESDNKDSDHDENHPTEVTKLLQNNMIYS